MPKLGRSVDVHTLAKALKQIIYIKVMMLSAKLSMVDFVSLLISYPLCRKYNKLSALFRISANNV